MTVDQEYGRPFASKPYAQLHIPEIDHFVGKSFEHGHLQPLHLRVSEAERAFDCIEVQWLLEYGGAAKFGAGCRHIPHQGIDLQAPRLYRNVSGLFMWIGSRTSPDLIMEGAVIETERGLSHSRAQRLRRFIALLGNHDLRGRDRRGRLA